MYILRSLLPNIIFILTDDQDAQMDSLSYMPYVQQHLVEQGTHYQRHYCTVALCCPSRVSLLTGKAAHNTNVTDVFPPYGGYPKFVKEGYNKEYLPIWLQDAGYNTYYTGKFLNYHHLLNYFAPFPAGWTSSDFLLDPFTYNYLENVWQRDRHLPVSASGQYSTDVLAEKAYAYVEEGAKAGRPFFLTVAPIAPHANLIVDLTSVDPTDPGSVNFESGNPVPAERHKDLFQNATIPRTLNFNPDKPSGVSWISRLPKQNDTVVAYNDEFYRDRLRSLQAVDEMVDGIFQRLEELGILENTYVVYSSDNGFHIGQHRLQPGKQCGFEEDINVPLIIRGPNVPKGQVTDIVTTHTDLAPTFFSMLGLEPRSDFDGVRIPLTQKDIEEAQCTRHEHINVENWGTSSVEGIYGKEYNGESNGQAENTYKAMRLVGREYNLYYSVYCNNQRELYDMNVDPYQMHNLIKGGNMTFPSFRNTTVINNHTVINIVSRLDALLMVLKTCKAKDCIQPWSVLHPGGDVNTLEEALNHRYDHFYYESFENNKVSFSECEYGQILSSEGPLDPWIYNDGIGWSP
ncbi:sulfatase family protein [Aspergillus lucknowensis]|uniref:Arylsulfatase n=1 Tax=Aspergillus lucknowensis TaxID=176173 RepID=A0ABR4LHV6_9EURO